jgi:hypothetical protein
VFVTKLIPAHFTLQYVTSQLYVDIMYMFMLMSVVGVEFGVAVSRHNVCSSYVCAVC